MNADDMAKLKGLLTDLVESRKWAVEMAELTGSTGLDPVAEINRRLNRENAYFRELLDLHGITYDPMNPGHWRPAVTEV